MRKHLNAMLAALAIVCVSAPMAAAQTKVVVMNSEQVLRQSKVGQHIQTRWNELRAEVAGELEEAGNPLASELQAFREEVDALDEAQVEARRADLEARGQMLAERRAQLIGELRAKEAEVEGARVQALEQVSAAVRDIIEEVVAEQDIDIIIERAALVYRTDAADITGLMVERLDAKMTEVPVERVAITR